MVLGFRVLGRAKPDARLLAARPTHPRFVVHSTLFSYYLFFNHTNTQNIITSNTIQMPRFGSALHRA